MAELSDEVKRRVVTELAGFRTPAEIRGMLREEYNLDVTTREIIRYDATRDYCVAGESLKALFQAVRKDYVEGTVQAHIAKRGYRLQRLQLSTRR